MVVKMRRFNERGIDKFRVWINDGAIGEVPFNLLENDDTSEETLDTIEVNLKKTLANRYELGKYLAEILKKCTSVSPHLDRGLWTALSLVFFDHLCPVNEQGIRKPLKEWHYVLSVDFRHHYRHLLRSPWLLYRKHGEHSRFILLSKNVNQDRLGRHGDILEQLGGRQAILRSESLVREVSRLFSNSETGRPRNGVTATNKGGTVRRLGLILRQLDLTYDIESMSDGSLLKVLPREFDRWKPDDDIGE